MHGIPSRRREDHAHHAAIVYAKKEESQKGRGGESQLL